MRAPREAKRVAVARPMPLVPPVIRTTLLVREEGGGEAMFLVLICGGLDVCRCWEALLSGGFGRATRVCWMAEACGASGVGREYG